MKNIDKHHEMWEIHLNPVVFQLDSFSLLCFSFPFQITNLLIAFTLPLHFQRNSKWGKVDYWQWDLLEDSSVVFLGTISRNSISRLFMFDKNSKEWAFPYEEQHQITFSYISVPGSKFQRKTISILIGVVWLYSLLWAVFPLLGWGGYGPEPYGLACSVDWAGYQHSLNGSSFIMALAILCTLIPCAVILFSYTGIAWKLHKVYQSIQSNDNLPNSGAVERKVTLVRDIRNCTQTC